MEITKQLDLAEPVAMAGDTQRVWIADACTNSVIGYDPPTGKTVGAPLLLPEQPLALAVLPNFLIAGLVDGSLYWYNLNRGQAHQQIIAQSGQLELRPGDAGVWVWDPAGHTFHFHSPGGFSIQIPNVEMESWTASDKGVYWIDYNGTVWFSDGSQPRTASQRLAATWQETGAMVCCSNVLWVSIPGALQMVSLSTLETGPVLPAPEGPVAHLLCDQDQRTMGGSQGLFILDPAADANVQAVEVKFDSPLQGLICSRAYIWGLETAKPIVHILRIP